MSEKKTLTTAAGAPVADNQNSQTAGPAGPVLMQDHHLIEKLARFDRERIPERVVHARGSAAYGYFEVTHDVSRFTKAKFLNASGKRTEVFLRFSTVALELGSADTVRDPRGFALKFYTEDGNYDLVGNNTPVFFIRDPLKFPDFIHSQKRDPYTHVQEPDNAWDFFSHSPEATHQFTWLFGDRGIPASYRHMDGFGSHTFLSPPRIATPAFAEWGRSRCAISSARTKRRCAARSPAAPTIQTIQSSCRRRRTSASVPGKKTTSPSPTP